VIAPKPVPLEGRGIRLEPLTAGHRDALAAAASDGRLWELWFTSVPAPDETAKYIDDALNGQRLGHMLPWVVRELASDTIIGTTRYHDIVPLIDRVEIGYTLYGSRWQRTHVNTTCKLLLLAHAFDVLRCAVVGLAPIASISRRRKPSPPSAPARTAFSATTRRGATGRPATR